MGIIELFEIDFFSVLWDWDNGILTIIAYSCVIVGIVLQMILQKKYRKSLVKWLLIGICGVGIIISECVWHTISGWDRLGIDFIYGFIICVLLGAIIANVICAVNCRLKNSG